MIQPTTNIAMTPREEFEANLFAMSTQYSTLQEMRDISVQGIREFTVQELVEEYQEIARKHGFDPRNITGSSDFMDLRAAYKTQIDNVVDRKCYDLPNNLTRSRERQAWVSYWGQAFPEGSPSSTSSSSSENYSWGNPDLLDAEEMERSWHQRTYYPYPERQWIEEPLRQYVPHPTANFAPMTNTHVNSKPPRRQYRGSKWSRPGLRNRDAYLNPHPTSIDSRQAFENTGSQYGPLAQTPQEHMEIEEIFAPGGAAYFDPSSNP